MNIQENIKQYANFFNTLPDELKKIILSEDTPLLIGGISLKNGVTSIEMMEEIAYQTTRVLLEQISWEDFQKILTEKLKIDEGAAKKISEEINEAIFVEKNKIPQEKIIETPKLPKNDAYQESIE